MDWQEYDGEQEPVRLNVRLELTVEQDILLDYVVHEFNCSRTQVVQMAFVEFLDRWEGERDAEAEKTRERIARGQRRLARARPRC